MEWELNEYFEPVAAAEPEVEVVPEGVHEFRITKVVEDSKRMRVDLGHDDRRYSLVFADLPKGVAWASKIVGQLVEALGMSASEWAAATPATLKGRRVRAKIYHKVGNSGRLFVNVGGFEPSEVAAEPGAAASRPARRTPTQKADAAAAGIPEDEIPF